MFYFPSALLVCLTFMVDIQKNRKRKEKSYRLDSAASGPRNGACREQRVCLFSTIFGRSHEGGSLLVAKARAVP